ncbi:MAG: 2-amino-4-hydroxy-6-hydroxymethyldihydropteridine diphosphokinase [Bergeyella sp.]|nr:2-amino-4-hydroxy-6-hydroxymethyldihydropteridine diphosphokinase [Bergeyella sp.]
MNKGQDHLAVLLLGSNLGKSEENLLKAISILEKKVGRIERKSGVLFSEPVDFASDYIFCNIAVNIRTESSPIALLNRIKEIERSMGRLRDSAFYNEHRDRIIDIDIVFFDGIIFESKKLNLPHSKHLERGFSRRLLMNIGVL